MLHWFI